MRGTRYPADKVGRDPVDPRIHRLAKMMDCRLISAFTRVFRRAMPGNDGGETVVKQGDSCYIGPNENREIVNCGNEVCTIAVAVAPVK